MIQPSTKQQQSWQSDNCQHRLICLFVYWSRKYDTEETQQAGPKCNVEKRGQKKGQIDTSLHKDTIKRRRENIMRGRWETEREKEEE